MDYMKTIYLLLIGMIFTTVLVFLLVDDSETGEVGKSINDYKNIQYTIEGVPVKLTNGVAKIEIAPGSNSKIATAYFGNEVVKDLDGDEREDIAFILTQTTGGTGNFFYLVGALNKKTGYIGSDAVLLGDRIAPQTTESGPGDSVIVRFMERLPDEAMTTSPSVGKSLRLRLDPVTTQWGIVVQDFEGEASPSRMNLNMKEWIWQQATYGNNIVTPKNIGEFTLTFLSDGVFTAKTDCNSTRGSYTQTGDTLTFSEIYSTEMYCEGSQEADFGEVLQKTSSFKFTSKGELILSLDNNEGTALFR